MGQRPTVFAFRGARPAFRPSIGQCRCARGRAGLATPVPRLCRVDAAVELRDAFAELAVGPGPRGYVVHRVLAAGDEPAVDVEAPHRPSHALGCSSSVR